MGKRRDETGGRYWLVAEMVRPVEQEAVSGQCSQWRDVDKVSRTCQVRLHARRTRNRHRSDLLGAGHRGMMVDEIKLEYWHRCGWVSELVPTARLAT